MGHYKIAERPNAWGAGSTTISIAPRHADIQAGRELAIRFVAHDHRVQATFEGQVVTTDADGHYFDLPPGGEFVFTDRRGVLATVHALRWELLNQPNEASAAATATVLAEINRRSRCSLLQRLEEIESELLAEDTLLAGGIDSVLGILRSRDSVSPNEWLAARAFVHQAVCEVLISLDTVGDMPALAAAIRALLVGETRDRLPGLCWICQAAATQLNAPTRDGLLQVCERCFVEARYLGGDHSVSTVNLRAACEPQNERADGDTEVESYEMEEILDSGPRLQPQGHVLEGPGSGAAGGGDRR
jgi:hypothetical protein